jgi:hypothetical protein
MISPPALIRLGRINSGAGLLPVSGQASKLLFVTSPRPDPIAAASPRPDPFASHKSVARPHRKPAESSH